MLNPDSPIPLYHQLAEILLEKIRSGVYPPGARIPSEHRLAETFGIGRPTARQATDRLVRKNVLVRRRGAGTFVKEPAGEIDLFSLGGTISAFQEKGIDVQTEIVQGVRLADISEDPENPFARGKAFFLSRLSHVASQPVLIEDIYLHPVLFAGIDRFELAGRSLSQVVAEKYYLTPARGTQNFRIRRPDPKRAGMLGLDEETPILLVKRFLHFPRMKNGIFSELYCRTDRFVFSQTLGGIQHG